MKKAELENADNLLDRAQVSISEIQPGALYDRHPALVLHLASTIYLRDIAESLRSLVRHA